LKEKREREEAYRGEHLDREEREGGGDERAAEGVGRERGGAVHPAKKIRMLITIDE
jgi:hypothetical protein